MILWYALSSGTVKRITVDLVKAATILPMQTLIFASTAGRQVLDITEEISAALPSSGSGFATIFTPHTGAAITTANLDPGTDLDLLDFLKGITPHSRWRHPHNPEHAPDHLLASIIGPSMCVPYENGRLLIGTWQYLVLLELAGPRERKVIIGT